MKKPKPPRLVTVAIFTTITIIFWIFYSVYQVLTGSPPSRIDPELLEPINPEINEAVLNDIEGRLYFEEGQTTPLTEAFIEAGEDLPEEESVVEELTEEEEAATEQQESTQSSELTQ